MKKKLTCYIRDISGGWSGAVFVLCSKKKIDLFFVLDKDILLL